MSDLFKFILAFKVILLTLFMFSMHNTHDISNFSQIDAIEDLYNPELAPFYHGVASGDPLFRQRSHLDSNHT